jgi:hypothetical protein
LRWTKIPFVIPGYYLNQEIYKVGYLIVKKSTFEKHICPDCAKKHTLKDLA